MQNNLKAYYVFKEKEFIENYRELENSFKSIYPNFRIGYSYKTNYTPHICRLVKELGGYAEVVSEMEYNLAKSIGYSDQEIIFNGPNKEIYPNCMLNIDSLKELDCTNDNEIGIRVNIDVGQKFVSRFGMDSEDIEKCFEMAKDRIVGLHCHISQARSLEAWEKRAELMLKIADKYFGDKGPKYIDLGSGMFGKMPESLYRQFSNVPSYTEYAETVATMFKNHYGENGPTLVVEPGTTLVSNYIDFHCFVENIKHINENDFVIVNASKHNLGEICELKNIPFCINRKNGKNEPVHNAKIVGYTCLEHDVMVNDFSGEIAIGDEIIFENVGGYSLVMKPPFIRPNVAMYNEKNILIKREERAEEIFSTYE